MDKIYKSIIAIAILFLFCGKTYSQCSTAINTPYFENFSSIAINGQLPGCWAVSNATTCLTFTAMSSNSGHASFYNDHVGDDYFYTRAIQLEAGITYSSSLWYFVLGTSSQVTWTDLSILLGTSQNSVGLTSIVSSNGNVINTTYTALTNTFTVASSGVYYIAIKATSNGVVSGNYLNWDDLLITVPCTASYNSPNIMLTSSSTVICSGDTVTINALGADTYTWNNGSQGVSVYTTTPMYPQSFTVSGTNTLSGCTSTASIFFNVTQSPNVILTVSGSAFLCYGGSLNLIALGANTYTWSNGQQGSTVTISPTVSTVYSVVGTSTNGCMSTSTQTFDVYPLPVISYTSSAASSTICKGDLVTFTTDVQAGLSYTWSTNNGGVVEVGQAFTLSPVSTVTVYLTGKDQYGCSSTYESALTVNECASLTEALKESEINIYPNPGTGTYHIVSGNSEMKTIDVIDLAGKIIYSTQSQNNEILLNLNSFDNGIYQVNISSESGRYYYKIIKQ